MSETNFQYGTNFTSVRVHYAPGGYSNLKLDWYEPEPKPKKLPKTQKSNDIPIRPPISQSPDRDWTESPIWKDDTDYGQIYANNIDNIFQKNYPKMIFSRNESAESAYQLQTPQKSFKFQDYKTPYNWRHFRSETPPEYRIRQSLETRFKNSPDPYPCQKLEQKPAFESPKPRIKSNDPFKNNSSSYSSTGEYLLKNNNFHGENEKNLRSSYLEPPKRLNSFKLGW
ncbi:unnamed protein product [Blepharisma stoltei]|uniref:Uncharacterized protein n=1 Tax=Blepharisma stoltei TaxID=1481888 RepID=A0AAU9IZQ2_9CILI|nr:unnamed protein product [Blepharisma stoltei]